MLTSNIETYTKEIAVDDSEVARALSRNFSVSALVESANRNAHLIPDSNWADVLAELQVPRTRLVMNGAAPADGIQEMDLDELELVSGGYAAVVSQVVVAAYAAVNVAVYANVVGITFVAVVGAAFAFTINFVTG